MAHKVEGLIGGGVRRMSEHERSCGAASGAEQCRHLRRRIRRNWLPANDTGSARRGD